MKRLFLVAALAALAPILGWSDGMPARSVSLVETIRAEDGRVASVRLHFGESNGLVNKLYVFGGFSDCGESADAWPLQKPIVTIPGDVSDYDYVLADEERSYSILRFALLGEPEYVADGIFSRYDAKDNAGIGIHADTAMYWADLVGGFGHLVPHFADATTQGFESDAWVNRSGCNYWETYNAPTFGPTCTVEVCLSGLTGRVANDCGGFVGNYHQGGNNYWIGAFGSWVVQGMAVVNAAQLSGLGKNYQTVANVTDHTFSLCAHGKNQTGYFYINGGSPTTFSQGNCDASQWSFYVNMSFPQTKQACFGSYHSVRFYSRALSPEEVAWNAQVDDYRFFKGVAPLAPADFTGAIENGSAQVTSPLIRLQKAELDEKGCPEVSWILDAVGDGATSAETALVWSGNGGLTCTTTEVDSVVGASCSMKLPQLYPGRTYSIKLIAKNDLGAFGVSATSSLEVPHAEFEPLNRQVSARLLHDAATGIATGICVHVSAGAACDLYEAYGRTDGGNNSAAWDHADQVAALPETTTDLILPVPQGWGQDVFRIRFLLAGRFSWQDYVQRGLFAIYDAEQNSAEGHTDDTSTWCDLVGGFGDLVPRFSSTTTQGFTDKAWVNESGVNYWETPKSSSLGPECTIEVCVSDVTGKNKSDCGGFVGNYHNGGLPNYWIGVFGADWRVQGMAVKDARDLTAIQKTYFSPDKIGLTTFTLAAEGLGWQSVFFIDGKTHASTTQSADESKATFYVNMSSVGGNQVMFCSYHSVRFYSCKLTDAEIAQNTKIDKARFGGGAEGALSLTGVSELLSWQDPKFPALSDGEASELWRGDGVRLSGRLLQAGVGGAANVVCELSASGLFDDVVQVPFESAFGEDGSFSVVVQRGADDPTGVISPGTRCFCRIKAVNATTGEIDCSPVFDFVPQASSQFASCSVSSDQRSCHLNAVVVPGAGDSTVWLEVAGQVYPVAVVPAGSGRTAISFDFPVPEFFETYPCVLTVSNSTFSAQTNWVTPREDSVRAVDAATYTWTGASSALPKVWTDSANWACSSTDCVGYPTAGASVKFMQPEANDIVLGADHQIAELEIGDDARAVFTGPGSLYVLEHHDFLLTGSRATLGVRNGARFRAGLSFAFDCNDSLVWVDDATFEARAFCTDDRNRDSKGNVLRISGETPLVLTHGYFGGVSKSSELTVDLVVPSKGWNQAVIRGDGTFARPVFGHPWNEVGDSLISFAVNPASPLCQGSRQRTFPVVDWTVPAVGFDGDHLEVDPDTGDVDVHYRRTSLQSCRLSFDAESPNLAKQLILSLKGMGGLKIIVK